MLTLEEHMQLSEAMTTFEALFDDATIDRAEYYDITEDPISLDIVVTLYDGAGVAITSATVDDYDTAVVYMEEYFDLEDFEELDGVDATAAASGSAWGHNATATDDIA